MNEVEKVTKETVRNGGVLAMLYFDIHTKTRELAQEIGAGFVKQLLQQQGVVYAVGEIEEPLESEGMFSTMVQVKLLARKFSHLASLCMTFSPFTVEILQPDEIRLQLNEAHELLGTIGTATAEYKKFIVERMRTPADVENYKKMLQMRAEMGKRILGRKGAEGAKKPGAQEAEK
jgi:hypothetical protein